MPTARSYRSRAVGSLGHMASFSFQSSKNLTAGEGGIITTNDDGLAAACRSIQNCGRVEGGVWYEHHVISGNYRLGEFQGAVLNCQLDRLEQQTATRDANGAHLARGSRAVPGPLPQRRPAECTRHAYHLFMLRLDPAAFGAPRDAVLPCARSGRHSLFGRLRLFAARHSRCSATRRSARISRALRDRLDYSRPAARTAI